MNFKIDTIPRFEKDVKKLKKKFPKIKNDLVKFIDELSSNPELGINLGENIFKVRIPNSSIPKVYYPKTSQYPPLRLPTL
ncbi:MAG: hypothetical protein Q8N78_10340 [Sulfurimonas sp.]|nr:hypothetical protein [Sulfurimonas sp.]